ncbi:MAG: SDR family oxidoreductase [Candidatus Latescibacteria bacterium]|nr:SDR family oxidoreductase [Candidatus Latescibacterota bacterium]MBT4141140.1 SDR family oxidoreductase [Candidatus Latescibacterota bacterium]MBT5832067.1 SDR family oxidoreductase [Candidatus Latescibacterota bacterium]
MVLENKVILVTGGSSGIGRTAALAFVREGAKVAVADVVQQTVVVWLCSDAASFVTGHSMAVDGGWTAH